MSPHDSARLSILLLESKVAHSPDIRPCIHTDRREPQHAHLRAVGRRLRLWGNQQDGVALLAGGRAGVWEPHLRQQPAPEVGVRRLRRDHL